MFIEIKFVYLSIIIKDMDMNFNIEGVFNLKIKDFKSYDEYIEFIERDENWDNLRNLRVDNEKGYGFAKPDYIYKNWDEIWVISGYIVARMAKGSNKVFINPDLGRFLLENSLNYVTEQNRQIEEEFIPNLNVDSILDRISEVGFENISEVERNFLKNNS